MAAKNRPSVLMAGRTGPLKARTGVRFPLGAKSRPTGDDEAKPQCSKPDTGNAPITPAAVFSLFPLFGSHRPISFIRIREIVPDAVA